MKFAATLLLIPVVAFAQAPGAGMDRGKMLEQMKQSMLPMMEKSLPEMENTRQCVQASGNSADLKKCAEIMQNFQKKMMVEMGAPADAVPPPQQEADIEWSQKVKDEILQGLETSIQQASAMTGCLQSSSTPEQMDSCMQQSGLSPKRN
jgi:hypothetical protein